MGRLTASTRWTLGIVPLLMAAVVFLLHRHRDEPRWWLIPAAVVSLHCVHIPYWFDGMLHWHYVFETGPLLLLIFARATQLLFWNTPRATSEPLPDESASRCKNRKRPLVAVWWGLVAAVALLSAYFPLDPFWKSPRVDGPLTEYAFSKRRYFLANQFLRKRIPREDYPALVLIEPDETQFHFEYITNDPDQRRERILRGRFRPGRTSFEEVIQAFPGRSVYFWRMRTGEFRRLSGKRKRDEEMRR